ncbi:MAG: hypothetical protein AABZ12_08585 [Planctomycetota bacterium]
MPSRLRRHDEAGHIHFLTMSTFRRLQFFRHPGVCSGMMLGMNAVRERQAIRWLAYVIMPEHVHLVLLPQRTRDQPPVPISTLLQEFKSIAGRLCKAALREVWRQHRSLGTAPSNGWARSPGEKAFWKPRGYDFNVLAEDKLLEKINYLHANPIRRGLVDRAEDWAWSSYRFYEFGERSPIAMDWDGGFPVL